MDSPSPLSDFDKYEIIGDSEGEMGLARPKHRASTSNHGPGLSPEKLLAEMPPAITAAPIDYFASFEDPLAVDRTLPTPSIADRAKTRKRKPIEQPRGVEILELTDEESTARKAKPRKKVAKPMAEANQTSSLGATRIPHTSDPVKPPVINARTKVRPRPVKKPPLQPHSPHERTSQETIPVLTSPFPPLRNPNSSRPFEMPTSDPPVTSPLIWDIDTFAPPIEFLPPPQDEPESPLPSSIPGENVDELQIQKTGGSPSLFPPPPTFFAGSSSDPSISSAILPAHKPPPPLPSIEITNAPADVLVSQTNLVDPSTAVKPRKPRKPKKGKGETGDNRPSIAEATPTAGSKKGKSRANQVTVEVLIPLRGRNLDQDSNVNKMKNNRIGKAVQGDLLEEDELNIQDGDTATINAPIPGPSSLYVSSRSGPTDADPFTYEDPFTKPSESRNRKSKRRKDNEGAEVGPDTTTSRQKKPPGTVEEQGDSLEKTRTPSKKPRIRKKKNGEGSEPKEKADADQTTRVIKSKGRRIIASDDDLGVIDAPEAEEAPPLSPTPILIEHRKGKRKAPPEDIETEADYTTDHDRNVLKTIQPAEPQTDSPSRDKAPAHQESVVTPTVRKYPSLSSRYTIAPKSQTKGISELLRQVNSHPDSPFPTIKRGASVPGLVYSPCLKSSRRTLSRIAPLHPNRKTPPPPLPPPPPRKKSKKELEMEEKWEEEIIEEIGGVSEWMALSEGEKNDLKRRKRDREMGYYQD